MSLLFVVIFQHIIGSAQLNVVGWKIINIKDAYKFV